jgi:hypothetical protein
MCLRLAGFLNARERLRSQLVNLGRIRHPSKSLEDDVRPGKSSSRRSARHAAHARGPDWALGATWQRGSWRLPPTGSYRKRGVPHSP